MTSPSSLRNILLVGGSGRNVGKTTFCEKLITKLSTEFDVFAIKFSNHFEHISSESIVVSKSIDFQIIEETEFKSGKDSSRYLAAGAKRSFFVVAKENADLGALLEIVSDLPPNFPIIVESGGLLAKIKPGLSVGIEGFPLKESYSKMLYLFDTRVNFINEGFDFERIIFINGEFSLCKK